MGLLQQGGQVTNLTSQQAANQAAQNYPGPNQPFDPRYGYMPNTAQFPGGYPGYQPMGGGMGFYPVANQLQGTFVYATVIHGEPHILDPETGKLLEPGLVSEIQNPDTHEGWRPGDSWTEASEKATAKYNEYLRQFMENFIRPAEEKAGDLLINTVDNKGQQLTRGDDAISNQLGRKLHQMTPGEGEYKAPEIGMEVGQKRADERAAQMQQQSTQQQMQTIQQGNNMNRPISQPMMQQSGGQPIMSR